jgi:hypothetical protein
MMQAKARHATAIVQPLRVVMEIPTQPQESNAMIVARALPVMLTARRQAVAMVKLMPLQVKPVMMQAKAQPVTATAL